MTRRTALLALAAGCLALALALGGTAPLGRLALLAGAPRLALALFDDPHWRGVAAYRAGRWEEAAAAFRAAGPAAFYDLGTALARAGRYAAALEAFDAALAQDPDDAEARANFDLVARIYAGTAIEAGNPISFHDEEREGETVAADIAKGNARAAGEGDQAENTGATVGLPQLLTTGRLAVRRVFDDHYIEASPRWLATLPDVPGEFLAARIREEWKRRKAAGLSPPEPEDPE